MISVLNWKPYNQGSLRGFFDLRYHGLTVKGCRLMSGSNGLWFSFPQVKEDVDGEAKYYDQVFLTTPERDHVRRLIVLDLQAQGHLERSKREEPSSSRPKPIHRTSEGENLDEYYSQQDDDLPF